MEFKKINVSKLKLNEDTQVSKTYTRAIEKNSPLEQLVQTDSNVDLSDFIKEQSKMLDDYSSAILEIFKIS